MITPKRKYYALALLLRHNVFRGVFSDFLDLFQRDTVHRGTNQQLRIQHSRRYTVQVLKLEDRELQKPHLTGFLWGTYTLEPHTTFWKSITKVTPFLNKGPILHQDSISFHLSYQPPLSVMCHFLCSKSDIFLPKSDIFTK